MPDHCAKFVVRTVAGMKMSMQLDPRCACDVLKVMVAPAPVVVTPFHWSGAELPVVIVVPLLPSQVLSRRVTG